MLRPPAACLLRAFMLSAVASLMCIPPLAWAAHLTPESVIASVKARGTQAAVASIWSDPAQTRQLLASVASAAPAWLEAARLLQPATDAGSAEDLNEALSRALLKAPYRVLPMIRAKWWPGAATLCEFAWDSELPGGVRRYVGALHHALQAPAPKGLVPLRTECLRGLQLTRLELDRAGQ